jgi:putative serine protease PepD
VHLLLAIAGVVLTVCCIGLALQGAEARALDAPAADPVQLASAAHLVTVAKVTARTCQGVEAGSGFVVADGLLVTAAHVVEGAGTATVEVDGRGAMPATVLGVDGGGRDVAVLAVPGLATGTRTGIDRSELRRGTEVAAAGHPLGGVRQTLPGSVVRYVDAGPLAADGGRVLTVTIAFEPGMSGGPVVDAAGNVVGVVIGVERNSGTGIAVPAGEITATLRGEQLAAGARCGLAG